MIDMETPQSARPPVGATIRVARFGECVVLDHTDPGVVRLRTPDGAEVKVGDRVLPMMLLGAE